MLRSFTNTAHIFTIAINVVYIYHQLHLFFMQINFICVVITQLLFLFLQANMYFDTLQDKEQGLSQVSSTRSFTFHFCPQTKNTS